MRNYDFTSSGNAPENMSEDDRARRDLLEKETLLMLEGSGIINKKTLVFLPDGIGLVKQGFSSRTWRQIPYEAISRIEIGKGSVAFHATGISGAETLVDGFDNDKIRNAIATLNEFRRIGRLPDGVAVVAT